MKEMYALGGKVRGGIVLREEQRRREANYGEERESGNVEQLVECWVSRRGESKR